MRRFYKSMLCAFAGICLLAGIAPQSVQAQQYDNGQYNNGQQYNDGQYGNQQYDNSGVTLQTFYDDLAPYGQWVEDPQYGYVFVPNVEQGFRPYYTDGHWVMTDYGNTWVSDYEWGWACFHYGRWTYDNYYGWVWVPGTEWGPAWVSWRNGGGYYGWAPMYPGFQVGMSFGDFYCPDDWWVFIPPQYIYSPSYYHYWSGPRENAAIINNTTIINNTYVNNHVTYVTGPRANDVESYTHKPVTIYKLGNSTNPAKTRVKGSTVKLFHPMVVSAGNGSHTFVPQNAVRAPQPIGKPQSAESTTERPAFHTDIQQTNPSFANPGLGRHKSAPQTNPGKYEWDVNRAQPQQAQPMHNVEQSEPMRQAPQPASHFTAPQPAPHYAAPAPAPRPAPMQHFSAPPAPRPASAPHFSAPAPRSAPPPAPAPHFSAPSGGNRR